MYAKTHQNLGQRKFHHQSHQRYQWDRESSFDGGSSFFLFNRAEKWVANMSMPAEDDPIEAQQEARPPRTSVKDRPKFKSSGLYVESLISQLLERIYFPFNIDQQHWVGVFVDTKATTINVLDCYVAFKSDSLLKREFTVVANTMPYIVRVANGSDMQGSLKLYSLTRCKGVPQVSLTADAAVMYVLLIEAHAKNGSQRIRGITSRVLPEGAKKLAVNFYNDLSAA
ncbi:hypothetical protein DY000_02048906 [Brassica cretica]|uniref:Ubiquitin-like protease family profile domain-containing protein n=1 Tax=Brassica cretica TaxID=69181 RepID=A0ABQ7F883_BRACR|nr:hypothetical protein DY000_02048906 [Brassica cretica]